MDASPFPDSGGKTAEPSADGCGSDKTRTDDLRSLALDLARLLARDLARQDHRRRNGTHPSDGD